jgi:hypothetical protein
MMGKEDLHSLQTQCAYIDAGKTDEALDRNAKAI